MKKMLFIFSSTVVVAGCVAGSDTKTSIKAPTGTYSDAEISVSFSGWGAQYDNVYDYDVGAVAFAVGVKKEAIHGYVGITDNPNVGSTLQNTVTFSTKYDMLLAYNVNKTSTTLSADMDSFSNQYLILSADIDKMTLTGSDGRLVVNGKFADQDLSGSVQLFRRYNANLFGHIGSEGVIGAFEGNSDDYVLVGGFVGTPE